MTIGLLISALLLGLRHGFDWDHLAAIGDISATQEKPKRGIALSSLYAGGHAVVVLAIGTVAVVSGRNLPNWIDEAMGVVVGWTLILLGLYVGYTLVRHRGQVPMQSRWMIVLSGIRRGYVWLRKRINQKRTEPVAHTHSHSALTSFHHEGMETEGAGRLPEHEHYHVHDPDHEPFTDYTPKTSLAIGALHGIGAETPTQVLIFIAAASAGGVGAGLAVLVSFLIGLVIANTVIAIGAAWGFSSSRNGAAYKVLAGATAAASLVIGILLVSGQDQLLPALLA